MGEEYSDLRSHDDRAEGADGAGTGANWTPERTYCPNCGEIDSTTREVPGGLECECGWLVELLARADDYLGAVEARDEAVEALRRYGDHDRSCRVRLGYECSCGFAGAAGKPVTWGSG